MAAVERIYTPSRAGWRRPRPGGPGEEGPMRVAVVFFGIARGLAVTLPGLRDNLILPAAAAGIRLELLASLNLPGWLDNPRTGEQGVELDPAEALLLGAGTSLLVRQEEAAIAAPLAAAQRQRDHYGNG